MFLLVDTGLFVDILNEEGDDAPSRIESWIRKCIQAADCDPRRHRIEFVSSTELMNEYEYLIGVKFGRRFFLGLEDYFQMNDGSPVRIDVPRGQCFLVPLSFAPEEFGTKMLDKYDRKLRDLVAFLLRGRKYRDRAIVFGCKDTTAIRDIERMCAKGVLQGGERLKVATSISELTEALAD